MSSTQPIKDKSKLQGVFRFGNSKAEVILLKILNEANDKSLTKYISTFLTELSVVAKNIRLVQSDPQKVSPSNFLYKLLRDHFDKRMEKSKHLREHPEVRTYFRNSMIKRLKVIVLKKSNSTQTKK